MNVDHEALLESVNEGLVDQLASNLTSKPKSETSIDRELKKTLNDKESAFYEALTELVDQQMAAIQDLYAANQMLIKRYESIPKETIAKIDPNLTISRTAKIGEMIRELFNREAKNKDCHL